MLEEVLPPSASRAVCHVVERCIIRRRSGKNVGRFQARPLAAMFEGLGGIGRETRI